MLIILNPNDENFKKNYVCYININNNKLYYYILKQKEINLFSIIDNLTSKKFNSIKYLLMDYINIIF